MISEAVIHDWLLPYESRLERRSISSIDMVVIHCTELPDLQTAREYGERILYPKFQTGNSGHYYLDRDGSIYRFVNDHHVAHHVHGYNSRSIGIELVNEGRYPAWQDSRYQTFKEPYSNEQLDSLLYLLKKLCSKCPTLKFIAGHEDLDRRLESASDDPMIMLPRRRDPGPLFPWQQIIAGSGLERFLSGQTH